jgi:hypothetical protein
MNSVMSFFPRPSSPKVALADLRAFLKTRTPHQLGFAAAAITIPVFMLSLFLLDAEPEVYRLPEITWIESYKPGRTDAEIVAEAKIDAKARKIKAAEEKATLDKARAPFKKLDKAMDDMGL